MKLKHLKHKQIDLRKWDETIAKSQNPIFYNSSWFLNVSSPNWEALADKDYSIIFPLTVKTFYGLKYIAQCSFSQQTRFVSAEYSICERLPYIKVQLPFVTLSLQSDVVFNGFNDVTKRVNLIIRLGSSFQDVEKKFNNNTKRNIRKSETFNLRLEKFNDSNLYINFANKNSPYEYTSSHFPLLKKIIDKSIEKKHGELIKVLDEKDEILSVGFFISQYGRKTFLSGFSSPTGFKKRSMFFLINQSIKASIGKINIFDFEGSSVEGVANFYRGFGAEEEEYYLVENKILKRLYRVARRFIR